MHATAAAWSEALKRTGIPAHDADCMVARGLDGYRLRGERGDHVVTASAVQQWRKQARQRKPSGVSADAYRTMLGSFRNIPADALNQAVPAMMRIMLPHLFG